MSQGTSKKYLRFCHIQAMSVEVKQKYSDHLEDHQSSLWKEKIEGGCVSRELVYSEYIPIVIGQGENKPPHQDILRLLRY